MNDRRTAKTALVTGASSGIGLELARAHAKCGGDLIVVARREAELRALKDALESDYGVHVDVVVDDLADDAAPGRIFAGVEASGRPIDYLVNNAGFGGRGLFHEREWGADRDMIQVNVVALSALTRLFLPGMVARGSGRILNVSSPAGDLPGPLQAVYFATKAYVTSFTYALHEELSGTGVTTTALIPGATNTGFADRSGMTGTALFNDAASPEAVAEAGYEAMLHGRLSVVAGVPLSRRVIYALAPLLPTKTLLRMVRRAQEAPRRRRSDDVVEKGRL
ncbi:MAG: SDR family oxidoreductase [Pseudomonadota bacterium]